MNTIVITAGADDTTLMHVEGAESVTTGGDGLGFNGWDVTQDPQPFPPAAVDAFRLLADSFPDLFEIRTA